MQVNGAGQRPRTVVEGRCWTARLLYSPRCTGPSVPSRGRKAHGVVDAVHRPLKSARVAEDRCGCCTLLLHCSGHGNPRPVIRRLRSRIPILQAEMVANYERLSTLIGAMLGGSISLLLNRQQMRFEHTQRRESELEGRHRQSVDRRFQSYSDFLTSSRIYRDSIRSFIGEDASSITQINEYAQAANSASALVFLVTESADTHDACRLAVSTIGTIQTEMHRLNARADWRDLNKQMADTLRRFQVAARDELGVRGVDPSEILTRRTQPSDGPDSYDE